MKIRKIASVHDTALDGVAMGADTVEYMKDRDESRLKLKSGMKPTYFYVRRIPASVIEGYVLEAANDKETALRSFIAGVQKIENLVYEDENGEEQTIPVLEPQSSRQFGSREVAWFSDSQLELIPTTYKLDIGGFAFSQSFLARTNGGYLPPPRILHDALTAKLYQDAEDAKVNAPQSNEKPSSKSQSGTDQQSDEPTDAPVKQKKKKGKGKTKGQKSS